MTATTSTAAPVAGMRHPFWLFALGAAIGCTFFLADGDGPLAQQAFIGAMWGAFGAVPVVIVAAFVLLGLQQRRAKKVWLTQGPQWYRDSFPEHAPAHGKVSCRFCGMDRVHPRNLNGRGDVRAWVCGECGQTLYFSNDAR